MKFYLDITLLPGADLSAYFLWGKVYRQLHLALVDGEARVGVAFPEYCAENFQLGSKLRLLSPEKVDLESLHIGHWLARLTDYVHITSIREVPENAQSHAMFRRVQPKSNNARLARRMAKRKNISLEQALLNFEDREEAMTKLPFIQMKSHSSDNRFRLFIEKIECKTSSDGKFNSYGLSSIATVPWF